MRQFLPIKVQKLQILYNKSLLFALMKGYNITFTWIALLKSHTQQPHVLLLWLLWYNASLTGYIFFEKQANSLLSDILTL